MQDLAPQNMAEGIRAELVARGGSFPRGASFLMGPPPLVRLGVADTTNDFDERPFVWLAWIEGGPGSWYLFLDAALESAFSFGFDLDDVTVMLEVTEPKFVRFYELRGFEVVSLEHALERYDDVEPSYVQLEATLGDINRAQMLRRKKLKARLLRME